MTMVSHMIRPAHAPSRTTLLPALIAACGLLLSLGASSALAEDAGQKLFDDNGCNKCHSVSSKGIKATKPPKEGEVDLSGVGLEHDAKWISGYLLKKEEKDGKKHKKKFTGEDAELEALSKWLASLKDKPKK